MIEPMAGHGDWRGALLVIAKRPRAGETKTRLCPPLSPARAADLYAAFLDDTLDIARAVPGVRRFINYAPPEAAASFRALAPDFDLLPQTGPDLGARLDHALTACLTAGFARAVITDSDSPTLPAAHVARAFDLLGEADVVLGPCADGGYYLIGLTRPCPRLLREVPMSTPTVLQDTLTLARTEGLRVALLPPWYDVDTAAELAQLQTELARTPETIARHTRACLRSPAPTSALAHWSAP